MYNDLLEQVELKRKEMLPSQIISAIPCIIGLVALVINPFAGIFFFIIGVALVLAWAYPASKRYKLFYKETIVNRLFSEAFGQVNYIPEAGFSKEMISQTGFMMMGNRYHSEDMISGTYKDIPFKRSDVLIQDHRSNGKSSYTVTYFRGRWITLKYNKRFHTDLQLIQSGFGYTRKKSSFFTRKEDRRHKVEFENEAFNRMFNCYCQSDQEAFYLITPSIMEGIMKYVSISDGKIMLGFKDDVCHIAIENGKDSMEPSVFSSVTYEGDVLPLKTEINAICDFVNLLNLDRDIFMQ